MKQPKKSYVKNKILIVEDVSGSTGEQVEYKSAMQAAKDLKISYYRLHKLLDGTYEEDFIRSKVTGILYRISLHYDYVVHARPEILEYNEMDFVSATKCIKFFGITKSVYYNRASNSYIGVENPRPIKDRDGINWYLTFLKPINSETGFKDEINHGN